MKKYVVIALLLIVAGLAALLIVRSRHEPVPEPQPQEGTLNGKPLQLELALTDEEQYAGLSNRAWLCPQCGMLFMFAEIKPRTFVMREMSFPLDIIWIREGRVTKIDARLSPEASEPYTPYESVTPVDQVLELNAGGAAAYGLFVGSNFNLNGYGQIN